MLAKLGKAALLVVVLSTVLSGTVFAEGHGPDLGRGLGQVTALAEASFTVVARSGQSRTLQVDAATTFEDRSGEPRAFSDVEIGDWLAGTFEHQAHETLVARRVIILGPEIRRPELRAAGEITAVDPGDSAFDLHTRRGEDLRIQVTVETRFRGRDGTIQSVDDLEPGMVAAVTADRADDGALEALAVVAGRREDLPGGVDVDVRVAGRIVSVEGDSLTILTLAGAEKTFSVDGSTVFRSRDGTVDGIEDLQPGQRAIVAARQVAEGEWMAVWVGVGRPVAAPR
jgi:hypothetical protein